MRVLAIDPGTVAMGYGVVDSGPPTDADDYGVLRLPRSMPLEERLYQLHTHILNMINIFHPDAVAVEEPFVGRGDRQFVGPAIAVGQAQALVFIGAASQNIPVFRYSPAQIKLAVTDYGGATKEQMQRTAASTLGLHEVPSSDAADALCVGLCHLISQQAVTALDRIIPPGQER